MKTNTLYKKLVLARMLLVFLGVVSSSFQKGVGLADGTNIPPQSPRPVRQDMGTKLLIPSSAYSDTFTSSLVIMNQELGPNTFIISAYDTNGNPLGTPLMTTLVYGKQFRSNNILKDLGAPFGSFGPIKVESTSNRLLSAVSEVRSSQGFAGFFPGLNVDAAWNSLIILDVVDDGARGTPSTYRTNLGLNAVRPGSTNVTIVLYNDSGQWVKSMSTILAGNGLTQLDGIVQQLRGTTATTRGYLRINSSQPIIAWASKIENGTDDPSFQIGIETASVTTSQSFMTSSLRSDVAQEFLRCVHDWDWKGGENAMRRVLEMDPNNLDARYNSAKLLMAQGRFPEALGEIQMAEQLHPLSQHVQVIFGKILFNAGKPDAAILRLKRALERDSRNPEAHYHLAQIYEQMGKYNEALAIYDKARVLRGNPPDNPRFLAVQAGVYARLGRRSAAKRMLVGIKTSPAAAAHAYLGDKDDAFRMLFSMVEEREPHVISLKSDPQFASLHSDPRWAELLRRMNLPVE